MANNINQVFAISLLDQLLKFGITNYYVSPGLRNAPLISALTKFKGINVHTDIDERSAAYRALGLAKAKGEPSVLVCTSGTALLNYTPSLAEAYKTNTPIIVLSADRPTEMVAMNTNQTINQKNAYQQIGIKTINLESQSNEVPLFQTIKNISFSVLTETFHKKVPLHINIPFREPLDDGHHEVKEVVVHELNQVLKNKYPLYQHIENFIKSDIERPLIIVGSINNNNKTEDLVDFIRAKKIPNICDITSGIKLSVGTKENTLPSLEHHEVQQFIEKYQPTSVIQIGERFISKKYDSLFSNNKVNWYVVNEKPINVPNNCPTLFVNETINRLKEILPEHPELNLSIAENLNKDKRSLIESTNDLTLPLVTKRILDQTKNNDAIFVGNSSIVRSFDYYINTLSQGPILNIFSNRGVSGIEGNIATIAGIFEAGLTEEMTAVLGDISFLHDLSSLKNLSKLNGSIKIFVINDGRGGIFGLLPLELNHETKNIMATPHSLQFKDACKQFNVKHYLVENKDQLTESISQKINTPTVYEVIISPSENFNIYQKLKTMKY